LGRSEKKLGENRMTGTEDNSTWKSVRKKKSNGYA